MANSQQADEQIETSEDIQLTGEATPQFYKDLEKEPKEPVNDAEEEAEPEEPTPKPVEKPVQ